MQLILANHLYGNTCGNIDNAVYVCLCTQSSFAITYHPRHNSIPLPTHISVDVRTLLWDETALQPVSMFMTFMCLSGPDSRNNSANITSDNARTSASIRVTAGRVSVGVSSGVDEVLADVTDDRTKTSVEVIVELRVWWWRAARATRARATSISPVICVPSHHLHMHSIAYTLTALHSTAVTVKWQETLLKARRHHLPGEIT